MRGQKVKKKSEYSKLKLNGLQRDQQSAWARSNPANVGVKVLVKKETLKKSNLILAKFIFKDADKLNWL